MPILYKGAPKMASQPVKCLQMSPKCLQISPNVSKMSPKCLPNVSIETFSPSTGYTNLKFLTPSLGITAPSLLMCIILDLIGDELSSTTYTYTREEKKDH